MAILHTPSLAPFPGCDCALCKGIRTGNRVDTSLDNKTVMGEIEELKAKEVWLLFRALPYPIQKRFTRDLMFLLCVGPNYE